MTHTYNATGSSNIDCSAAVEKEHNQLLMMGSVLVWRRSPSSPFPASSKIENEDTRRSSATPRLQSGSSDGQRHSRGRSGKGEREKNQGSEEKIEACSRNSSQSDTVAGGRAARVWKVVDAKTIFTKRKYVRKVAKKRKDDAECVTTTDDDLPRPNRQATPDEELARLRWSSPEGGPLQGVPFECFPHQYNPSIQEALDYRKYES